MKRRRDAFPIGGVLAPAGRYSAVQLPIGRLPTGSDSTMPVAVLHGDREGPTVWISSAIHGDELNGVAILRRVLKRIDPHKLAGTILGIPVVNPMGLLQDSRYLPDRRDLNRSFPGSRRGSLAAQIAHLFMTEIVDRADVGLDLHTGSGGRKNLPHVRCDLDDPETHRLARAFSPPLILHSRHRDGSLRAAAGRLGKPALVFEGGEAGRFDEPSILTGVRGILGVLAELGMWEGKAPSVPPSVTRHARSSHWVRARRAGFCEVEVELGAEVEKGQVLATVYDSLGKSRSPVRAAKSGVVLGLVTRALVHRGDAVAHVAIPEPR